MQVSHVWSYLYFLIAVNIIFIFYVVLGLKFSKRLNIENRRIIGYALN